MGRAVDRSSPVGALVLLWLACTGGVFVWLANFDLDPTSRSAMRVFFIPVGMGLAIPLGFALDWAIAKLRGGLAARPAIAGVGIGLIALALPLWQCGRNWQRCDYSNYWYAADHAENMLTCVLDRALVFPSGDHNTFPLMYAILVERRRSDVIIADPYGYINPKLLKDRPADSSEDVQAWLIRYARRPVYFTTKKRVPIDRASFVTAGILYHLLPDGVAYDGEGLYEKCNYRNLEDPGVLDRAARHILADYEFFGGLQKLTARDTAGALVHFAQAVEYAQDIKELYNNVGSALGEHGLDDGALPYFQRAAELDARYVMPRWNLFRFYRKQEQWQQAAGQLEQIIRATPQDFRAHGELGFLLADSLNNPDRAVAAWERSLSINPKQPQVLRALSDQLRPATPAKGDPD